MLPGQALQALPLYVAGALQEGQWEVLCREGETFAAGAGAVLRYGAHGSWLEVVVAGAEGMAGVACNATFGYDPAENVEKCLYARVPGVQEGV